MLQAHTCELTQSAVREHIFTVRLADIDQGKDVKMAREEGRKGGNIQEVEMSAIHLRSFVANLRDCATCGIIVTTMSIIRL